MENWRADTSGRAVAAALDMQVFERASSGVDLLRSLVLGLAVRGALEPQLASDGTVDDALKLLGRQGSSNTENPPHEERPASLPRSWTSVPLKAAFEPISTQGKKVLTSSITEAGKFPVVDQGQVLVRGYSDDEAALIRIPRPVIVFGDHTRQVKYIDFDFVAGADGTKILLPKPPIDSRYFYWCLRSYDIEARGYGRHYARLLKNRLPLPPLAEQKRIVAKVDQLMALCDELEAKQTKKRDVGDLLTKAALSALTSAETPAEFKVAWRRASENFRVLVDSPLGIAEACSTIRDLAVRGLLTATTGVVSDPSREAGPFPLPHGWAWIRFGDAFDIQGGTQPPKSTFRDSPAEGYVRLLQIRDLGEKPVPTYVKRSAVRRFCSRDDIMLGRYGASIGKVFWGQDGAYNVALARVIFDGEAFAPSFVFHLLKSGLFQTSVRAISRSAQAGFNKGDLAPIRLPKPPLAEQKRIVAKVDQLVALCDELDTRLTARDANAEKLAEALVANAVA